MSHERSRSIRIGERVKVHLDSSFWQSAGWFEGTVMKIEPYSKHRRFYWVELDEPMAATFGSESRLITVLNPKHIQKL